MANRTGSPNKSTVEFRAAWDAAASKARFDLVRKLLLWCRSRDPDISLKAINLALQFRYSKPATKVEVDAPTQMVLGWADDELNTPEDHEQRQPTKH